MKISQVLKSLPVCALSKQKGSNYESRLVGAGEIVKYMGDDSSRSLVKALKGEWSLFWETLNSKDSEHEDSNESELGEVPSVMSLSEVRELTKKLVEDRQQIYQKLELISKEIDLNSAKLESLRLVGAEGNETLNRIHELNDLGQNMTTALSRLDKKLRQMREKEDQMSENSL